MANPAANLLLASLIPDDLALLTPSLVETPLEARRSLEEANALITHAYFPVAGLVSIVAVDATGHQIEAGVVGSEGMTALAVVLGDDRSPNATFVQIAGEGLSIAVEALNRALADSPTLHARFLRFAHVFSIQVGQTALANGRATLEQRLARWLLMAQDRINLVELPLTHEFLALMLGVRRAGVTVALHELEGEGLLRSVRGQVIVRDRDGLLEIANGYYGTPELAMQRLLAP